MPTECHMAPDAHELTYTPPTAKVKWVVEGEFDPKIAANILRATAPATFDHPVQTLFRNDGRVRETGFKIYECEFHYGVEERDVGTYTIECDTLGGTTHVKGGSHIQVYPASMPTHDGLIGVKGDDVEGTDIVIPAMRIIVHFSHPGNYLTDAIIRTLSRAVGSVDNSGFLGWEPYETLFLGFQAKQTTEVTTIDVEHREEVSYHFAMSENLVNFAIAGITGISKKGWDVAWVKWQEAVESGRASNEALYVNIVRVYKEKDLRTILGFG